MATELFVNHDIQVAHRLINLPGKCQQIHGHTMTVTMYIIGPTNQHGYMINDEEFGDVLDFGAVKKDFRSYLDGAYDHHLLLNENDELLQKIELPGVTICEGDPCVENIAKWIYRYMSGLYPVSRIQIDETATNGVTYDGNDS